MQLTILGGGGFRVPLVYQAVAEGSAQLAIDEIVLADVDEPRLQAIAGVIDDLGLDGPRLRTTTRLEEAIGGADFVFSAIRVGGVDGRVRDERVALDLGLLGQETIGAGGLAFAMRTIPVAHRIAELTAELAPQAWLINFTNPAGIVTEVMQRTLGDRVVGICDTPIGLVRRVCAALGVAEATADYDYLGLNHLGWLRSLRVDGLDRLPDLLADDALLDVIEEARVVGPDWVRAVGALPNEYLYYYWNASAAAATIAALPQTRGEYVAGQQREFYGENPSAESWRTAMRAREASYMAESREGERRAEDVAGGGYQGVALALMARLVNGPGPDAAPMILDVANHDTVPALPGDVTIEVACDVDRGSVRPRSVAPPTLDQLGLMARLRGSERLAADAALTGDARLAWRAFAEHPLISSPELGRRLFDGYRRAHRELAARFPAA